MGCHDNVNRGKCGVGVRENRSEEIDGCRFKNDDKFRVNLPLLSFEGEG